MAEAQGSGRRPAAECKLRRVELHWYEAHGIGKRDIKIKRYLDTP